MPNPSLVGTALRGARLSTGITEQDHRLGSGYGAQARDAQAGRGAFINYYDDLDLNASADRANSIRKEEKDFNSQMSAQQASVDKYKSDLDKGYGDALGTIGAAGVEFPHSYTEALETSWKDTQKNFVKVNVYTDDKFEQSYLLPKEAAEQLSKDAFDGGEGHFASLWTDDGLNVDTRPVGIGTPYGQELHQALIDGQTDIYNQWYTQNATKIQESYNKGFKAFQDAYSSLGTQYATGTGNVDTAQATIDNSITKRKNEWDTIRGDQKRRTDNNRGVLSSLQIESV